MNTPTRRHFLSTGLFAGTMALTGCQTIHQKSTPPPYHTTSLLKISCAAYGYRKYLSGNNATMTILDFLDECAKMNLGAAEPTSYYFPPNVSEEYLLQFKRKAFSLGLTISGTAIGNTFTHDPGPERDKQLELCQRWVDNAAIMGAPVIRIFAGNVPKGITPAKAIQNAIETTKIACDYAAKKGVILALENHGGIVATPEPMLEILAKVDSPWFGFNLDSGNFHSENPYAELELIAPHAVNAQIKVEMSHDGKKYPADMDRIIKILVNARYRGYVALEYEAQEEPKTAIPRYINELRAAIARNT
jgi:sugar phosphate isomerase/epimerase